MVSQLTSRFYGSTVLYSCLFLQKPPTHHLPSCRCRFTSVRYVLNNEQGLRLWRRKNSRFFTPNTSSFLVVQKIYAFSARLTFRILITAASYIHISFHTWWVYQLHTYLNLFLVEHIYFKICNRVVVFRRVACMRKMLLCIKQADQDGASGLGGYGIQTTSNIIARE